MEFTTEISDSFAPGYVSGTVLLAGTIVYQAQIRDQGSLHENTRVLQQVFASRLATVMDDTGAGW